MSDVPFGEPLPQNEPDAPLHPNWSTQPDLSLATTLPEIPDQTEPLLTCLSDCPGVLLSGSLETSLIAAIVNRAMRAGTRLDRRLIALTRGKLHSFSIGLPGSPDLKTARTVANFLSTFHHEFKFTVQVRVTVGRWLR